MVKTVFRLLLISLSLFLVTCDNYEFPRSPYPRIETLPVTNVSSTSVTFRGNLLQLSDQPAVDHGFVWGFTKSVTLITGAEGVLRLGPTNAVGEFDGEVVSGLYKDTTYYVRAFVATEKYKVYGDAVEFTSNGSTPPVIDQF